MEKVGIHTVSIHPFEVDFKNRITLPLIVNHLLNTAGRHANERGFGIQQLNEHNHTWVLSRLAIELNGRPECGETLRIRTWIENVMRSFTLRNFQFETGEGEVIGYARSIWAMIDTATRHPVSLIGQGIEEYIHQKDCPIEKPGKIIVPEQSAQSSFVVAYSDLDINKHLNSAKYVEHITDTLPIEVMERNSPFRFEIEYIEECHYGERIQTFWTQSTPDEYLVALSKGDGKMACKCKITFK